LNIVANHSHSLYSLALGHGSLLAPLVGTISVLNWVMANLSLRQMRSALLQLAGTCRPPARLKRILCVLRLSHLRNRGNSCAQVRAWIIGISPRVASDVEGVGDIVGILQGK
jgi:hypothetical protein